MNRSEVITKFAKLFLFFVITCGTTTTATLPNLDCRPRPMVIATSHDNTYKYYPYFINLYRCMGSKDEISPLIVQCEPDKIEDIHVNVRQTSSRIKSISMKMENHTRCKTTCVLKKENCKRPFVYDSSSCQCTCPANQVGPPNLNCQDPKKLWSNQHCACVCTNTEDCKNKRKYFDQDTCSCRCKRKIKDCQAVGRIYDADKCACKKISRSESRANDQGISTDLQFWICAMMAELVVMLVGFDLILYQNKSGMIFYLTRTIRRKDSNNTAPSKKVTMAQKETLYRKSTSFASSHSLRKRSSRHSSVHPTTLPSLERDFTCDDDVFTS